MYDENSEMLKGEQMKLKREDIMPFLGTKNGNCFFSDSQSCNDNHSGNCDEPIKKIKDAGADKKSNKSKIAISGRASSAGKLSNDLKKDNNKR